MVAKRQRHQRPIPELDEYGMPPMKGVDTSASEDPAVFWGPNWKAELDESLADVEAGRVRRFSSDEEFLSYLEGLAQSRADV
jgi:hypothetical protein